MIALRVKTELNTLLVTLYVQLDDRNLPAIGLTRDHPGRNPALNDAELLCLLFARNLLGISSDRRWIDYVCAPEGWVPEPAQTVRVGLTRPARRRPALRGDHRTRA